MKNRNIVKIIIAMLVLIIVIIGGIAYMGYKEQKAKQQEQEELEVETDATIALKNEYKNIKEIEFLDIERNSWPRSNWNLEVRMSNGMKSVDFGLTIQKGSEEIDSEFLVDEEVQDIGITTTPVKVIYTNGKETTL